MLTWKMQNYLNESDLPEWEKLLQSELGETIHPGRKQGFCLARQALREALLEQGSIVQVEDLTLRGFHLLPITPQYTISLTHTAKWGAAILGKRQDFFSVGIDIEPLGRVVKKIIRERISHKNDISLNNLELWCIKEAAFKSAMNTGNFERPIEFSDLVIQDKVWAYPPGGLKGEWELCTQNDHLVAVAFMRKQNSSGPKADRQLQFL